MPENTVELLDPASTEGASVPTFVQLVARNDTYTGMRSTVGDQRV